MLEITRDLKFSKSIGLKCIFYYFKLCGVAPVNLKIQSIDDTKVNRWTFSNSWIGILYNLFLIVSIFLWNLLTGMLKPSNRCGFDNCRFEVTIYTAVNLYSIVNTACITLTFCFKRKETLILFNKINDVRETIKNNDNTKLNCNALVYKIVTLLIVSVTPWIALFVSTFCYEFAIMLIPLSLCLLIQNTLMLQYCVNLNIIEDLFLVLNRNLSDSLKNSSESTRVNDGKLAKLWEWHSLLSKLSCDLSRFYSLPMLFNTMSEFFMTTTSIYYIVKPIVYQGTILTTLDYFNSIAYVLSCLCLMILLTTSVASVIDEVKLDIN